VEPDRSNQIAKIEQLAEGGVPFGQFPDIRPLPSIMLMILLVVVVVVMSQDCDLGGIDAEPINLLLQPLAKRTFDSVSEAPVRPIPDTRRRFRFRGRICKWTGAA
jgi:hypothetical protein